MRGWVAMAGTISIWMAGLIWMTGLAGCAPPPAVETPDVSGGQAPRPIRIEYGDHRSQFGELLMPVDESGVPPVVVLVHGGFWQEQFRLSLMDDLATDLAGRGFASWNIEYRRVGGDGGWPATGHDVAAAIDHLAVIADDYAIDLDEVLLVGHSAGGHLALWSLGRTGAVVEPVGAVGLGAVVDLAYFAQSQGLLAGAIDQVPQAYADAQPVLDPQRVVLLQGQADVIVPRDSLAPARDAGIEIVTVPGDHFDLIDPTSSAWQVAVDELDQLLN